jgi:undecaprenyl-diphosphatase
MIANGSLAGERDFLTAMEASPPYSFSSAVWYQTLGTDITLWILVALMAGIIAWNRRPIAAFSVLLGWLGVDLVVRFSWVTWNRIRPDIVAHGLAAPAFASFPSGHTGKTLAVYGVLCYLWARQSRSWLERIIAFIIPPAFAALVGYSRLRMGVHWPTDILGGAILGLAWLIVLIAGIRMEERARQSAGWDTRSSSSSKQRRVAR